MHSNLLEKVPHMYLLQYLVRTPVPQGGDGHADDGARPRQVRVHWVSEQVEGVISRDAAGRVWHADRRDGAAVSLHQSIPATDLGKASTSGQKGQANWRKKCV